MTEAHDKLRALAEAVRDAGARLHATRLAFEDAKKACHEGGCFAVWGRNPTKAEAALDAAYDIARDAHHAASDALRAAQKALYADAPPDGIILALLDENARLREERDTLTCETEALQAERDTARLELGKLRQRLRVRAPEEGGAS